MKQILFRTFLWVLFNIFYILYKPLYSLYHWILLRDLALWDEDANAESTPSTKKQREEST